MKSATDRNTLTPIMAQLQWKGVVAPRFGHHSSRSIPVSMIH